MPIELRAEPGLQVINNKIESISAPTAVYDQVRKSSYSIAEAEHPGIVVTPSSRYCWFVNEAATKVLAEKGSSGAYLKKERYDGEMLHAFIAEDEPMKAVLDFQYQQFVPEDLRTDDLPKYMRIPYKSERDVIAGLLKHRIPEKYHEYWLDELNWSGRFPPQYILHLYASSIRQPERTF